MSGDRVESEARSGEARDGDGGEPRANDAAIDAFTEALAAFEAVIAAAPEFADAYLDKGHVLRRLGRTMEAIEAYARATTLQPDASSYGNLAYALWLGGHKTRAAEVVQEWLGREPDNPVAKYLYASFSGSAVPARADDGYITTVFDNLAETFDERLKSLGYRAPALIADMLERTLGTRTVALDILDAGCGTGLCGPLLRPRARRLAGIDLSRGMLLRARARNAYDALAVAELTAFLASTRAAFDLVVAADTLCYFGDLRAVSEAVLGALRPGGHFVFTVEDAADDPPPAGFRLHSSGRYVQSEGYVRERLAAAGFEIVEVAHIELRTELARPVAGLLVAARRPARSAPSPAGSEPR